MKKILTIVFLLLLLVVFQCSREACAADLTREEVLVELQLLKERMLRLEQVLAEAEESSPQSVKSAEKQISGTANKPILRQGERGVAGHLRSLSVLPEDKAQKVPVCNVDNHNHAVTGMQISKADDGRILRQGERGVVGHWQALREGGKGIEISGALEIEAGYENLKPKHGKREDSSFLDLATVELVVDAYLSNSLRAHIIFDYEDGEGIDIDEAMLHFQAEDVCQPDSDCRSPWFASLGQMTVPFGYYESHFISDPLTLLLGETQEVAALAGVHGGPFTLATGVYNGDMDEVGKDDHIDSFVVAAFFHLNEEAISDFSLKSGISYISNIADSNELTDFFDDEFGADSVIDRVAGVSAFLSLSFKEIFMLEAEWVSALDNFKEEQNFEPEAWNLELAFRPLETMELGLRYSGSDNALGFLPETQIGAIVAYEIFANTSIGIEYLYEEYQGRDKANRVTTQLGVEF